MILISVIMMIMIIDDTVKMVMLIMNNIMIIIIITIIIISILIPIITITTLIPPLTTTTTTPPTPKPTPSPPPFPQLSFEQQDLLKTVADVEALANLTGLPLLDDDPRDPSAGLRIGFRSLSPPVRSRRRRQYESLPQCKPRTVVEPIEQHFDGVRAIPTCIERRICGGCCSAGRLCVATKTKTLTKKVIQLIGTSGVAPVLLNVTDDEECQCICKIKASDCTRRHQYDPDNCACRCKRSLEKEKDTCESLGRSWDFHNCKCVCNTIASKECSSGYTFDEFACGCIPAE
ncbi:uncharacterized protein LOC122256596 [Penaeus japonicus]|uniref:uncharacterized protein LOC122256596 n=1 Tax=Penaeus japonicus TaxID=27405 RepID=UPI001C70E794|nr:uncharacterized protein LOC122256596 [Penaeus japonicus]